MTKSIKRLGFAALSVLGSLATSAPALAQTYYYNSTDDGAFSLITLCLVCLCTLPLLGINIYLTMDAVKRNFGKDESMRLISVLIIWLLTFPIGALVYFLVVMKKYPKS